MKFILTSNECVREVCVDVGVDGRVGGVRDQGSFHHQDHPVDEDNKVDPVVEKPVGHEGMDDWEDTSLATNATFLCLLFLQVRFCLILEGVSSQILGGPER